MARLLAALLLVTVPAGAAAQDLDAPSRDEPSDEELIRWASHEVGRVDGRSLGERPPVPPDAYLAQGGPHDLHLVGEDDRLALRLLAEVGGGLVGVLAGGGIGALVIWAAAESNADPTWLAIAVGTGAVLGSLGVTGGVTLAADLCGGRGNFGHAFLGEVIGAVAALPLVVLAFANDALPLALVAAGVLPLAGAMLGYEVGHADRVSAGGPIAFVTPTPSGALATVAGPLW